MKLHKIFFIIAIMFTLRSIAALAEEIDQPIVCNGDEIEYFEKEKKVVGSGHVVITYKDTTLTCDKITVFTETKEAQAEGNVRIVQGESFFGGEAVNYNFEKETGTIVNFKGYSAPWYTKGESAERAGADKFIVDKGSVTTCDHDNPHYRLSAKKVLIYPNVKVVLRNATVWVGPVPVFWMPVYIHPLDENRPKVTVIPGKNSDWGGFLLTAWRYDLDQNHKGIVHIDSRERKGIAYGVDHTYNTGFMGKGTFKTYYTHEKNIQRKHLYEEKGPGDITVTSDKYLAQIRHKWQISDDTLATAELYKYKDKDFRKDYFNYSYNNEYEKDEDPNSYLLVTKTQPVYTLSVLTEKRANRFEDRVERLPEVALDINTNRVGDSRFYYTGNYSAVNLNRKFPRSTDTDPVSQIPAYHNNRYDTFNKMSYAEKVSFLNITPFVAMRQTYYERGLLDHDFGSESHLRGIFYSGVDVSTKFYKIFYTKGSPLGMEINNLRHVITPTVSYAQNTHPSIKNSIYEFDEIDSIDRNSAVAFSLENKLQTKRGKHDENVDLARLTVATGYDFKRTPGGRIIDYTTELELRPYDWLTLTSDATMDPHKRAHHKWLKLVNSDLVVNFKDYANFGLSHSYANAESNNITGQFGWRINPKWKIQVYESFDIKRVRNSNKEINDLREQQYVLTRDLHCWEMDLRYSVFRERGEQIMVIFRLKAFPNIPFEWGRSYHEPKRGSVDYNTAR